jgi:hypothetical protein
MRRDLPHGTEGGPMDQADLGQHQHRTFGRLRLERLYVDPLRRSSGAANLTKVKGLPFSPHDLAATLDP